MALAGVRTDHVIVAVVTTHNHVWRVDTGAAGYFVKTWTKDWYDWSDSLTTGALNVDHEVGAFELLARHGLAVPEVVLADETANNPLGRPFMMTRQLGGSPFPDALAKLTEGVDRDAPGRTVGGPHAAEHAR